MHLLIALASARDNILALASRAFVLFADAPALAIKLRHKFAFDQMALDYQVICDHVAMACPRYLHHVMTLKT